MLFSKLIFTVVSNWKQFSDSLYLATTALIAMWEILTHTIDFISKSTNPRLRILCVLADFWVYLPIFNLFYLKQSNSFLLFFNLLFSLVFFLPLPIRALKEHFIIRKWFNKKSTYIPLVSLIELNFICFLILQDGLENVREKSLHTPILIGVQPTDLCFK